MVMGLPALFKLHKYKRFTYTPRYYNEQYKEEFISHPEENKQKEEVHVEVYTARIKRGTIRHYFKRNENRSKRISNTRLIIILLFLLAFFYLLIT